MLWLCVLSLAVCAWASGGCFTLGVIGRWDGHPRRYVRRNFVFAAVNAAFAVADAVFILSRMT